MTTLAENPDTGTIKNMNGKKRSRKRAAVHTIEDNTEQPVGDEIQASPSIMDWASILAKQDIPFTLPSRTTAQSILDFAEALREVRNIDQDQPMPTSLDFDVLLVQVNLMRIAAQGYVIDAKGDEEHKITMLAPYQEYSEQIALRGRFWGIDNKIQFFTSPGRNGSTARFILNVLFDSLGGVVDYTTENYQQLVSELNIRNEHLGLTHAMQRVCPICGKRFFPRRSDQEYDRTQCANAASMRRQRARKAPQV